MMSVSMRVWDGVGPALDARAAGMAAGIGIAMQHGADEMEHYAKTNAPWQDQTGAARNGLNAHVEIELDEVIIVLAHGVDYGYWLELIQDGEYAILMPTLEAVGPRILAEAGAVVVSGV